MGLFDWPPQSGETEIERLTRELAEADREIRRLRAILNAAGLDGVRGDALLPVKQNGGRGLF